MKKYLLPFILIFFASIALAGWQDDLIGVIGQKNSTTSSCTDSGLGCTSESISWGMSTTTYQQFEAQSGAQTYCQVCVTLYYNAPGDFHVEFWNAAHDTQYGDDSDSATVTDSATPGTEQCVTWSGTEPTVPDATAFDVLIYEESGNLRMDTYDTDQACYSDTNYDLIDPTDRNMDIRMELYSR